MPDYTGRHGFSNTIIDLGRGVEILEEVIGQRRLWGELKFIDQ